MMKNNLLNFLKKEYGEGYLELYDDLIRKNEIKQLEYENKTKLKVFARDIRDSLPTLSFARRNILFSEIIKILKIDSIDLGTDKIKEEIIEKEDIERKKLKLFIKNIELSLTKYETVFNLFWLRAGEAEMEGVSHEFILKTSQKALIGIKRDLEKNIEDILKEYRFFENKNNPNFKKIILNNNQENDEEIKKKKEISKIIKKFWNEIEKEYDNFKTIFIESMEKEIELKKQGKNDSNLIEETKQKIIKRWNLIENSYKNFEKEIKTIKEI